MMYVQVVFGFVVLIGGAEVLVRGAVSLASRCGISPMIIGMTVVAIGTSAPELVVSVNAAREGATGLAVGNVIGSNIANVLLVLGVACVLSPIVERPAALMRDGAFFGFGTLLFVGLCLRGILDGMAGVLLLIGFVTFIAISYWRESSDPELSADHVQEVEDLQGWPNTTTGIGVAIFGGLIGLAIGSEFLVEGGAEIARTFGVSEEVIGLTLLALGTSLPELAASVIAAIKGHADVGIGNVVGSN
ncbi:MAG: calcium/sodium antiporter, partial [Rhodospirillaceae bacterium]